ncbi:hypothetical protein AMK06_CH02279 [Rhizobium sp. N541]|uniref:hypothetical protein n=1 Tax=unclassified Rhizobium TaxID=2613769 RepID=UPI0007F16E2A|nr:MULTISPECIES: hypothetical protein [unclassified Rhizobium]ANM17175.1 hypothetical protein AMK06_CH02279 [Rhizobium sp. N541]ANM23560.1 hypothetical protein AMK07_CH02276 [Rhizobium sp. N941]
MKHGHNGSDSKIPVLPLVDILFSAFAAVLATATVAIVMMRVREPDASLPVLPFFTIVALSSDAGCTGLRPEFVVMPPSGKPVTFSEFSMADLATDNGTQKLGVNAWYFANTDQKQDNALEKICNGRTCAQAGLSVLSATSGQFKVKPSVSNSTCPNTKLALLPGPLPAQLSDSDFKTSEITFTVAPK